MKRLFLFCLVLVVSAFLMGYVVYLKDGSTYMAKKPYTVKGDYAVITLKNGSVIQVKLSLINVEKTKKMNKEGYTNVEVIDTGSTQGQTTNTGSKKVSSLGHLAKKKPGNLVIGGTGKKKGVDIQPGSGKGGKDKMPFRYADISRTFVNVYERQALYQYRIYQGSTSEAMRVEMTTDNENEVFKTITSTARVLWDLNKTGNKKINRVELFMATSVDQPAGRFVITSEKAKQLAEGTVKVENFFIENVIF